MSIKLGLNAKLYRNSVTTYDTPTWVEVGDVRNVTLTLDHADADVTTRANNGWRAMQSTLKDGTVEFELLNNVARTGSTEDYRAFFEAWLNRTLIDCMVLDAADDAGGEGLRAWFDVKTFTRGEELENAIVYSVTMRPGPGGNAPVWVEAEEEEEGGGA